MHIHIFHFSPQPSHTSCVRIGRLGLPAHQVVANVLAAVKTVAARVPRGFKNFQSLHLKTVDSIALPIYNSLPPLPTRLPGVGEEETAPIVKKIKLGEESEADEVNEEVENGSEVVADEQEEETLEPETVKKSSKRLKVSDYVDATLKHTSVTPTTSEIRGGVKRKVSLKKSLESGHVRKLSSKKIRGSTVISSQFEKAVRKRRRRTLN